MNGLNLGKCYRFEFDGMTGVVRCYPSGAREVQWAGMTFEYESADQPLKNQIDDAIQAGVRYGVPS